MVRGLIVASLVVLAQASIAAPFVYPGRWSSSNASEVKTGGRLTWYTLDDFRTINPFVSSESTSIPGIISNNTGLFTFDPVKFEYIPYMAQSYKVSANKLEWTFDLRSGMKWSDGKPIVADDFVITARIHQDPDVGSNSYESFLVNDKPIRVTKVDNDTLSVRFPSVTADALAFFSYSPWPNHVFGPVYAARGATGIKAMWTLSEKAENVVSAGPFKYASYRPGERAAFAKNPYFGEWNKDSAGRSLPYLDEYVVNIIADLNQAFAQFLAGEIDLFQPRGAEDLAQIRQAVNSGRLNAVLRANASPAASSTWITFNWNKKSDPNKQALFRNVDFRRAMSHLANRAAMVDIVYGGLAEPAYSLVYAVFGDWVSPNLRKYPYNLEEARKLLARIGYARKNSAGWLVNGKGQVLEFDLATNAGNTTRETLSKIFVDEAKKVGVKVNFRPIDFNTLVAQLTSSGEDRPFDAILLGLSGGTPLYPFGPNTMACDGNTHGFNRSGKCLAPFESQAAALYTRGNSELDTAKRKQIGYQIQDAWAANQPFVYLVSPSWHATWNGRTQGWFPNDVMNDYVGAGLIELNWVR